MFTGSGDAKLARANAELGLTYLHQGESQLAQEKLQLAYSQSPTDPLVLNAMGYLFEKMGDLNLANSYFLAAMMAAPESGTIENNYGAFLCRNHRYRESIPYFINASQIPHFAQAKLAYANARYCVERLKTTLGAEADYAYYTKLLWKQQP
jgi:type IV pilus assembly protein PilF